MSLIQHASSPTITTMERIPVGMFYIVDLSGGTLNQRMSEERTGLRDSFLFNFIVGLMFMNTIVWTNINNNILYFTVHISDVIYMFVLRNLSEMILIIIDHYKSFSVISGDWLSRAELNISCIWS